MDTTLIRLQEEIFEDFHNKVLAEEVKAYEHIEEVLIEIIDDKLSIMYVDDLIDCAAEFPEIFDTQLGSNHPFQSIMDLVIQELTVILVDELYEECEGVYNAYQKSLI